MSEKRTPRKITTVENQVKFSFRVPAELYEHLEKEAVQNGRSINSQLIQILKERYTLDPLTLAATGTVGKPSE